MDFFKLFLKAQSNLSSPVSSISLDLWTMGLDNKGSVCSHLRGKKEKKKLTK